MQFRDFLKIFGALILFHLAVIYREESGQLLWLSKPLLLTSLLLFIISKIREGAVSLKTIAGALFFSLAGDVALMLEGQASFLIGMGLFAVAHIFYTAYYWSTIKLSFNLIASFISLGLAILSLFALINSIEIPADLSLPIYIYFGIITLHLMFSANAFWLKKINFWPLLGILLFTFSDWWIAFAKFGGGLEEEWHNRIIIMSSYAVGQGAIALGIAGKD